MALGANTRASGPNESTQDTNVSDWLAGTSTSTQPSRRARTTLAPLVWATTSQAILGVKPIRAVSAGLPIPQGPDSRWEAASNPSGAGFPSPASFISESTRDSRYDRTP